MMNFGMAFLALTPDHHSRQPGKALRPTPLLQYCHLLLENFDQMCYQTAFRFGIRGLPCCRPQAIASGIHGVSVVNAFPLFFAVFLGGETTRREDLCGTPQRAADNFL
jgi:hypothetical protein